MESQPKDKFSENYTIIIYFVPEFGTICQKENYLQQLSKVDNKWKSW